MSSVTPTSSWTINLNIVLPRGDDKCGVVPPPQHEIKCESTAEVVTATDAGACSTSGEEAGEKRKAKAAAPKSAAALKKAKKKAASLSDDDDDAPLGDGNSKHEHHLVKLMIDFLFRTSWYQV